MLNLTAVDWLILLLSLAFAVGIGMALKGGIKTARDFFQAGQALPAWVCGLAFIAAGVGAQEVIGMGAAGARYGLAAAHIGSLAVLPAMLFVGLFMMPLYYGSRARSVPEFLRLRFDHKTRVLNACLFAAMMVFSCGISLYLMARVMQQLHLFARLFFALGWAPQGSFVFFIGLTAAVVLAYVLLGGLTASICNQVLQFFLLLAGFLPMVLLGLRNAGGWSGLRASLPAAGLGGWSGISAAGANSAGMEAAGLGMGLAFVLGAAFWCTDLRVIQRALAAKNLDSARRAPLIAAIAAIFLPFLLVLPGVLAVGLPTPHTTTVESTIGGAIVHATTVVRPEVEAGRGLVPAKVDAATGQPLRTPSGQTVLDYDMATPNMLLRFLPTGLLGLGLTALLACLMSGMAASLTAFNAVFTFDLYQPHLRKDASEAQTLAAGRWATAGGVLLSIGVACAVFRFNSVLDALQLVFALTMAPLLATVLLGMFWKRATGHGAFAGLIAGAAAALLHHGLTLPAGAHSGLHGGWLATLNSGWPAALHIYPSDIEQNFWTALLAFAACLLVTVLVSLATTPRPEAELTGLVYSLTPRPQMRSVWWKRPEALAVAILLAAIAVNLLLA